MTDGWDYTVDEEALRKARKRLVWLEDVILDDNGTVPPWLTAAKRAIDNERARREDGAG